MSKVSDFKISEVVIKKACEIKGVPFKDVSVSFDKPEGKIVAGSLRIGPTVSLAETIYKVVQYYFNNDVAIVGSELFDEAQKTEYLLYAASLIKRLTEKSSECFEESISEEPFVQRLYQRPLMWSLMKNIICPIYQVPVNNIKVVTAQANDIDVAKYYEEGEWNDEQAPKGEFIFINDSIGNETTKNALLFIETIKAHNLSPNDVMKDLLSSSLHTYLLGTLEMMYPDDEEVELFLVMVMDMLDISMENYTHIKAASAAGMGKTAQAWDMPNRNGVQWWYFGLPEKMLEPARGADWATYLDLEPWIQDFWNQVDKIKEKKPQGEGVNFNDLLRLKHMQSNEVHDVSKTMQALLSEQRVWA